MSAAYPLVRNLRALSTRCGVLISPSRDGSSPSSTRSRWMRSCICALYVACAAGVSSASVAISALDARIAMQVPAEDPNALYKEREALASAKRAAEIWAARLAANATDFESAFKLAQARYWLGTNGLPQPERKAALEAGIAAARSAIAIDAKRPEGH